MTALLKLLADIAEDIAVAEVIITIIGEEEDNSEVTSEEESVEEASSTLAGVEVPQDLPEILKLRLQPVRQLES